MPEASMINLANERVVNLYIFAVDMYEIDVQYTVIALSEVLITFMKKMYALIWHNICERSSKAEFLNIIGPVFPRLNYHFRFHQKSVRHTPMSAYGHNCLHINILVCVSLKITYFWRNQVMASVCTHLWWTWQGLYKYNL